MPTGYDPVTWTYKPTFIRTLDPVRAAALTAAVELCRDDDSVKASMVVEVAETFETFLDGPHHA